MESLLLAFFEFMAELGVIGIALGLMIEIIPSELVLGFGGYLISTGKVGFVSATLGAVVGGTIAQLFFYWLASYKGRPFLEKYGKYLFIRAKHLDMSEKWFNQYGPIVVFAAWFVPVIRHAIVLPAGIAKMSVSNFIIYTIAAILPWTIIFLYLGVRLGENWQEITYVAQPLIIPIMVIMGLGVMSYIVIDKIRTR